MTNLRLSPLFGIAIILICSAGCATSGKPPVKSAPAATTALTTTAPAPAAGMQTFDGSARYGITISYPAGYKSGQVGTTIFSAAAPTGSIKLFLDYHKLNAAEAIFANASLVDDNYQKDRREHWAADAKAVLDTPISIPDSDARKVILAGHENGKPIVGIAALIVHKGVVDVVTVECDGPDQPAADAVFGQVVASIKWTK